MSKKRIAASVLIVILAAVMNMLIFNYQMPGKNYDVNVNVTMTSDSKNGIELFYLQGKDKLENGFVASKSLLVNYKKSGKKQTLQYVVPGDVNYLRLDIGSGVSNTQIESITFEYKNESVSLDAKALSKVIDSKDLSVEASTDMFIVQTDGKDPYLVWNVSECGIDSIINRANQTLLMVTKWNLCIAIDVIVVIMLLCFKRVMIIPKELWQDRKLIMQLSKNDFKTKFAGSYLGIIWAFIQPIITVLVYWFVFEKGLKAGGMNTSAGITIPFVLWLVAGLVPWFFFQDSLNGGTNVLVEYSYLVKKVVFKISILPIVKMISALFVHLFFIAFMLVLYSAYGYFPDLYVLQIFYYTLCLFVLVLGIIYITSAIVVFFRDLTQVINIVLQVGMWMTPIMWNIDTMELSPVLVTIFKLNPMYYIVAGYRDALINKSWFWENPGLTIYYWIVALALLGLGVTIFRKLKIHFADVL